jgi:AcrR family transcriptional regulator
VTSPAAKVSRAEAALPLPQRLVTIATRLFAAHGYEATSVQQIVEAAGVTKGALYHHFTSKDDLLYEVYHRVLADQMRRLEEIANGPGDAAQRLTAVVADVIVTSIANLDELIVFFRSLHLLPAEQQKTVRSERRRYHQRVRRLVEEGQRSGVLTREIGTWYHLGGPLSAEDVASHFDRLMLSGLLITTASRTTDRTIGAL